MYHELPYERWDVYKRSLELCALARVIAARLPRQELDLADQVVRAATSVPLNIAEGAAEFSKKEKARFYRIAKRSAFECKAALSIIAVAVPATSRDDIRRAVVLAHHISRSLSALIRANGG